MSETSTLISCTGKITREEAGTDFNSAVNNNARSDPSRRGRRSPGRYTESSPDFGCR